MAGGMHEAIRDTLRGRHLSLASERARDEGGRFTGEARDKPFGQRDPAAVVADEEGRALSMNEAIRASRSGPEGRSMNEIIRGGPRGEGRE